MDILSLTGLSLLLNTWPIVIKQSLAWLADDILVIRFLDSK